MQCTTLSNRWQSERWEPVAIDAEAAPSPAAPVDLGAHPAGRRWRFGGMWIDLHPSEGEGYHMNVTAPEPKVFVMWRHADPGIEPAAFPVIVTVSYNQAARMLDAGEQVDAVPMTEAMLASIRPFVAEHYTPEARTKVRRNDPLGVDGPQRPGGPRR